MTAELELDNSLLWFCDEVTLIQYCIISFCSGCYGLEKCLGEFDLVDIQPGSKLWNLGLRRVDLSSSELSRQRDELEEMRAGLSQQMKQRQLALIRQEELRIQARCL